jgi:hypothetical protein
MVDMGQADRTLRERTTRGASYGWTRIVFTSNDLKRGDRCVIRQGEVLRIDPQWSYKEWVGCFSVL